MAMVIGGKKTGRVAWKKADGSPGTVQGVPTWTNSNAASYQMDVAADGQSALVTKLAAGDAHFEVTGDADLGSGVTNVVAMGDIMEDGAVSGTIAFTDEP